MNFLKPKFIRKYTDVYRKDGFRGVVKKGGWKLLFYFFMFYLIRDTILYILPFYLLDKGIFDNFIHSSNITIMEKMFHTLIPYALYILLLTSIIRAYLGKIENPKKDKILLLTLIFAHIQLILGILLLFPFPEVEISEIMKNKVLRFRFIEHPSMMLIGVIMITIGKSKSKKILDIAKSNKTIFIYFTIALVLIALRTPWDKLF